MSNERTSEKRSAESAPDRGSRPASPDGEIELRSFGRRHARRLREHQATLVSETLPALRLDLDEPCRTPLAELFPGSAVRPQATVREVWLEIGFGGGEHLLWQAAQNRDVGCIGCEPFIDGVAKVLSGIEKHSLTNVRLHTDDARDVIRWLPDGAIARAFILFPDPWPKKRHHKRRLVTAGLLRNLARVMAPGAELRMASDIGDYADQMLRAADTCKAFEWQADKPEDWRVRPADWPPTRYEQKAHREGRRCYYFRFARKATSA